MAEKVVSEVVLAKMQQQQELEKEFARLRPTNRDTFVKLLSYAVSILFFTWIFPEVLEQPMVILLVCSAFGVGLSIHYESIRINKRIDLLHRLLK